MLAIKKETITADGLTRNAVELLERNGIQLQPECSHCIRKAAIEYLGQARLTEFTPILFPRQVLENIKGAKLKNLVPQLPKSISF